MGFRPFNPSYIPSPPMADLCSLTPPSDVSSSQTQIQHFCSFCACLSRTFLGVARLSPLALHSSPCIGPLLFRFNRFLFHLPVCHRRGKYYQLLRVGPPRSHALADCLPTFKGHFLYCILGDIPIIARECFVSVCSLHFVPCT